MRKWWLEEDYPEGLKWRTLKHNGPVFPPPYEPHGVKMRYDGKPVELTPEQVGFTSKHLGGSCDLVRCTP